MGVYINMEMPKDRPQLLWVYPNGNVLTVQSDVDPWKELKAAPVPPHGRLGDLDRLEQMFADIDNAPYSGFDGTEPFYSAEDAAQIIRLAPTIIPESWEGE